MEEEFKELKEAIVYLLKMNGNDRTTNAKVYEQLDKFFKAVNSTLK